MERCNVVSRDWRIMTGEGLRPPEVLVWSARTTFFVLRPAIFSDCLRSPTRYCAKTSFSQTTFDSFHHASVFFTTQVCFFAHCRKVVRHSLRSGCDRSRGARVERKNDVCRVETSCLQRLPEKPHEILRKDFILSDNVRFLSPRKRVFFARCRKVVRHSLRSGCDRSRGARVERKNDVCRIATDYLQRLPKKPHEILCKDFILSDNVRFLSPRKCVFFARCRKVVRHSLRSGCDRSRGARVERKNDVCRVATGCLQRLPKKPHEILCKDFILSDNVRFLSPRKCVDIFSRVAGKLFDIHCAVAAIDPEVLVWSARTTFVALRPAVFSDCLRSPRDIAQRLHSFRQRPVPFTTQVCRHLFAHCRKVVRHSLRSGCDRSRGARVERKNDVCRVATGCLQRLPEKPHEILRKDFILPDNVRFLSPRKCVFFRALQESCSAFIAQWLRSIPRCSCGAQERRLSRCDRLSSATA